MRELAKNSHVLGRVVQPTVEALLSILTSTLLLVTMHAKYRPGQAYTRERAEQQYCRLPSWLRS